MVSSCVIVFTSLRKQSVSHGVVQDHANMCLPGSSGWAVDFCSCYLCCLNCAHACLVVEMYSCKWACGPELSAGLISEGNTPWHEVFLVSCRVIYRTTPEGASVLVLMDLFTIGPHEVKCSCTLQCVDCSLKSGGTVSLRSLALAHTRITCKFGRCSTIMTLLERIATKH